MKNRFKSHSSTHEEMKVKANGGDRVFTFNTVPPRGNNKKQNKQNKQNLQKSQSLKLQMNHQHSFKQQQQQKSKGLQFKKSAPLPLNNLLIEETQDESHESPKSPLFELKSNIQYDMNFTFFDHIKSDLGWLPCDENNENFNKDIKKQDDNLFTFIRVPIQLEKLIAYGMWMCVDSCLFVFTFLPIRFVYAVFLFAHDSYMQCFCLVTRKQYNVQFNRTNLYDIIKAIIIIIASYGLLQIPMSRIYHYIRGQTFMKLYVIFNILDVFDKLFCALGQDINDSLYLSTRKQPHISILGVSLNFMLASAYSFLHSMLYFIRVITLNVAINSTNYSLLTILISNNFVELKSSVFKRFAEPNLFQVSCSDIVERFEMIVYLFLTALQSLSEDGKFWHFLEAAMYIILCEFVVDWIKHAFIIKFNNIHFTIYRSFTETLCNDMTPIVSHSLLQIDYDIKKQDRMRAVARRLGLSVMPLTCVVLRFSWMHLPALHHFALISYPVALASDDMLFWIQVCLHYCSCLLIPCLVFFIMVLLKVLVNLLLTHRACSYLLKFGTDAMINKNRPSTPKEKVEYKSRVAAMDILSKMQRYTLFGSRVPT